MTLPAGVIQAVKPILDAKTLAPIQTKVDAPEKTIAPIDPPTLTDFVTWVRSAGLQKANRFFVDVVYPTSIGGTGGRQKLDSLMACEEITFPPRNVRTRTLRLGGLDERRASTLDYGGEFSLTFLVDTTHEIQFLYERWLNLLVDQTTREVGEYATYATTLDLWFLRPYIAGESYAPLSRLQNPVDNFVDQAKNRILNLAANEVGNLRTKVLRSIQNSKESMLGKQITTYNRIKSLLPLNTLAQDRNVSDIEMYRISFKEVFPIAIERNTLHQGANDVFRMTVRFAFKEYTTNASGKTDGKEDSLIYNFLKRAGIPTSTSSLARAAINMI